ncbi:MAG: Bug family tripartite tricarboxylate transporter substrate binding protein, partial [Pigmentiphaga sp.]
MFGTLLAAWLGIAAPAAHGEVNPYPVKPVTIVTNAPPGGPNDMVARLLAEELSKKFDQTFIVENRAGANGNIGSSVVARAPADAHTLLVTAGNALTANPFLYSDMRFDPLVDLTPIAQVGEAALVLVVNANVDVQNVAEFIEWAKRQPLRYSSGGNGSAAHLTFEHFLHTVGLSAQHIPYGGSAAAAMAVMSGEIEAGFLGAPQAAQMVQSGKARAIAASSPQRLPQLPDVPTVAESGYPDFSVTIPMYLLTPAQTDPALID